MLRYGRQSSVFMTLDEAIASVSKLVEDREAVMIKIKIPAEVAAKARRLGHEPAFLARIKLLDGCIFGDDDFWEQYLKMSDVELRRLWEAIDERREA